MILQYFFDRRFREVLAKFFERYMKPLEKIDADNVCETPEFRVQFIINEETLIIVSFSNRQLKRNSGQQLMSWTANVNGKV